MQMVIVNGTILDKIGRPVRDVVGIIKALSVNQAWAAAYLSYRLATSIVSSPASVTNFS